MAEITEGNKNSILYAFIEEDNQWVEVARGYYKAMRLLADTMYNQKQVRYFLSSIDGGSVSSTRGVAEGRRSDAEEKEILGMKKHKRNYPKI